MDIWTECRREALTGDLSGTLYRLVESQEQVATRRIVATLERQSLLEDMLENTKPPLPEIRPGLHYLLSTPFRYPPLPHGSRFGSRTEPSLLYGARGVRTVLAEAAYYRLVFWHGMVTPPPAKLDTQHTLFTARYRTTRGLRLQDAPCSRYRTVLTDPARYEATQRLGSALRGAGLEAFEYESARDPRHGINVALFTPRALSSRRPLSQHPWLCETSGQRVSFAAADSRELLHFSLDTFLVEGQLPQPAP